MTTLKGLFVAIAAVLFFASPALAGPPLICHPFETAGGTLLTWGTGSGWNTPDRAYDIKKLVADTNAVLTADAPILTRMRSLERIAALNPLRALPAHGPVIEDPLALIQRYVTHRAQREVQILEALAANHDTVESITDKVYPILQDALVPMARESVLAHLLKLQTEQRVVNDGPRWSIAR